MMTQLGIPSLIDRLVAAIQEYAQGRRCDIARGAETPALASLMVEKYGYGLMKAADLIGVTNTEILTAEVDRLVAEIDPEYRKHRQYRWDSRPAGLFVTSRDNASGRLL